MKTLQTGHGPVAKFSESEITILRSALELLEKAKKIESDSGKLHTRCYPNLELATVSLDTFLSLIRLGA